ncbi:MAG: hypothetical protein ACI9TO_001444 [Rickettsiales bacterium]|jgi:hypothetical protein
MTETTSKLFFLSKDREVFKDGNKFSQKNKGEDKKLEESDVKKLVKNRCELFLRSENLVILTGAGSSKDGGLLLVSELWEKIFPEEKDGSFSDRVGNLFLSINSKDDKSELFANDQNLKSIWDKFSANNKFNDQEAIDNLNKLLVFIKSCNENFSVEPLSLTTSSEELNVVLNAVIKEFEENEICPLIFRKSQKDNNSEINNHSEEDKKILEEFKTKADLNIEKLLTFLEVEKKSRENKKEKTATEEVGKCFFSKEIERINEKIKEACSEKSTKPEIHQDFLRKIIFPRKKTSPRAKIFTLNYDTFFEDAANQIGAVVIDGFCFRQDRVFSSTDFDLDIVQRENSRIHKEENFYNNVFHLYKMHGSVNWELKNEKIEKADKSSITNPLLIYPNSSKFEESYQMPFYEMVSRLQIALRAPNTSLITIGFSFSDDHINRIIKEAVSSNFGLHTLIVDPTIEDQSGKNVAKQELIDYAKRSDRIMFLGQKFAEFEQYLPELGYKIEDSGDFDKKIEDENDE